MMTVVAQPYSVENQILKLPLPRSPARTAELPTR